MFATTKFLNVDFQYDRNYLNVDTKMQNANDLNNQLYKHF